MADDRPSEPEESTPDGTGAGADSEDPTPDEAVFAEGDDAGRDDDAGEDSGKTRDFRWPSLRRSADDRLIAGVAGGLGAHFGIDPVIVRIGFIFLTFFGALGPALYLVAWLIVPLAGSDSILAEALRSDTRHRFRRLLGIALIVVGLFVTAALSRDVFELFGQVFTAAPYVALALIVAGVGLVFWPRRPAPPLDTPAEPLAAPIATAVPPPPPAVGSEWPGATPPEGKKETWRDRRVARRSARRAQSMVSFLTLAALLVLTGGAILLDRFDVENVRLGGFFAVAVLIVAAGLLVSVFVGRNWGLIVLGLVLSVPLVVFSGSDVSWWSGYGDASAVPVDADSLDRDITHGVGKLTVDLMQIDQNLLNSSGTSPYSLNIGLTWGTVYIDIPHDLNVRTNFNVGAGTFRGGNMITTTQEFVPVIRYDHVECVDKTTVSNMAYVDGIDLVDPELDAYSDFCSARKTHRTTYVSTKSGTNIESTYLSGGDGPYELELNVDVGIGGITVVRFPADQS